MGGNEEMITIIYNGRMGWMKRSDWIALRFSNRVTADIRFNQNKITDGNI